MSNAEKLKEHWQRVNIENCIHRINIEQKLNFENKTTENSRIWLTKVRVEFLPQLEMRNRTNTSIKPIEIFNYVENKFISLLFRTS